MFIASGDSIFLRVSMIRWTTWEIAKGKEVGEAKLTAALNGLDTCLVYRSQG